MTEQQIQEIKALIKTLLEKMKVSGSVEVVTTAENVQFAIRTPEGSLLIGENGKQLQALNHLVKKMAERVVKGEEGGPLPPPLLVDVNDYQSKRIEELRDLARLNAQRVRYFKKEIVLQPMSSFERRVVHLALASSPDVITQSAGEGDGRHIVIKMYE